MCRVVSKYDASVSQMLFVVTVEVQVTTRHICKSHNTQRSATYPAPEIEVVSALHAPGGGVPVRLVSVRLQLPARMCG